MSAADRRRDQREAIQEIAARVPGGWAASIVAAGPHRLEQHVDRAAAWEALADLRGIDLRRYRVHPDVVAAVKAARRAVLAADTALARALRAERRTP